MKDWIFDLCLDNDSIHDTEEEIYPLSGEAELVTVVDRKMVTDVGVANAAELRLLVGRAGPVSLAELYNMVHDG